MKQRKLKISSVVGSQHLAKFGVTEKEKLKIHQSRPIISRIAWTPVQWGDRFWATVCKKVRPMLSCPVLPVCPVCL